MCGNAQSQTSTAQGIQIRSLNIFLPEMHAIGTMLHRQLPVIIDKQARLITVTQFDGLFDLLFQICCLRILDPQLQCGDAPFQQAGNPVYRIHHRIEP